MTTELCFTGDIMCQMELTAACRSVRTFLDLPVDADVALQVGYPLPAGK